MTKIIELTTHPFQYPIAFDTTGIIIRTNSQNRNDRALMNNVEVIESFREVMFLVHKNYSH